MRYVREFKGFAGIRIEADDIGSGLDPAVLLLHDIGETRAAWSAAAEMLVQAGRHAINIDLRGHGASDWPQDGRYEAQAYVEDLRAVLNQMRTRPVVVAAGLSSWVATLALAEDAATLAAALVLVDMPAGGDAAALPATLERLRETPGAPDWDVRVRDRFLNSGLEGDLACAAAKIALPALVVNGGEGAVAFSQAEQARISRDDSESFNALLLDFLERTQPLAPPEYRSGSDARTLRDAMGVFATGVTIVTAHDSDGRPVGLTANSFTSVSLDPPLLLVCIANSSSSAATLRSADRFAVNVLQIGQQPTSSRFAGRAEDRFADTPWEIGETGLPVLLGSLGNFECTREAAHEAGDHFILVGRVVKASFEPRRDPLLYYRGKYRRLHFA